MAAFQFIAWILVALAIGLLGADAVTALERCHEGACSEVAMRSTADILTLFGVDGAAMAEESPGGVSQALGAVMGLPLWGVLGIIGVVLALIFRPID